MCIAMVLEAKKRSRCAIGVGCLLALIEFSRFSSGSGSFHDRSGLSHVCHEV
jgi:hypothetical protein